MKRTIALLLVVLAPSALLPQNAGLTPPVSHPTVVSRDPFAADRAQAADAERAWLAVQERLDSDVDGADPCVDAGRLITAAKDAAFRALTLKADYYRKHLEHQKNNSGTLANISADRAGLRQEIDRDLRAADRLQADLEQRRRQLPNEPGNPGSEKAVRSLNQLLSNTSARIENLRTALQRWDEAEDYTRQARELVREREEVVRQAQLLLSSESLLWQSFYDARIHRQRLTYFKECEVFDQFSRRLPE